MPISITPVLGVDVNATGVVKATDLALNANAQTMKLGTQVWGDDGKLYVLGQANASIAANTAVCTVNATTFLVTATGGAYLSPTVALVTGDRAWFSKASV